MGLFLIGGANKDFIDKKRCIRKVLMPKIVLLTFLWDLLYTGVKEVLVAVKGVGIMVFGFY